MGSSSEYQLASDAQLARVTGGWAREKLYYAGRYMSIFNGAMKNKWPSRVYVDLLAGPGRCISRDTGDEFQGSPLIALTLDEPFSNVIFVEADAELADALRARLRQQGLSDELVRMADANSPGLIEEIRERCAGSLALAFVDFLGMEVTFDTLRRLTHGRRMDLLLTLQVNDLTRNAPLVLNGEQDPHRWDAFFGTPGWRDAVRRFQRGETGAPDLASALTDFYCEQLGTLSYDYVAPLQRLMRNTINAPLYRLILAGKHPRAAEFFQKISRIEYDGQRGLPL